MTKEKQETKTPSGEMPLKNESVAKQECGKTRIVLVGTYKGDQLTKWPGWYNYPISNKDSISDADAVRITDLWLFQGTREQRSYKVVFVGIKTRKELIDQYGYPAKGKAHGEKYLLFKTQFQYQCEAMQPEVADRIIMRTADFATTPAVRRQLKEYLESPERNDPKLARRLPSILTAIGPNQLCVCELVYQMSLWDLPNTETVKPEVPFPTPENGTLPS